MSGIVSTCKPCQPNFRCSTLASFRAAARPQRRGRWEGPGEYFGKVALNHARGVRRVPALADSLGRLGRGCGPAIWPAGRAPRRLATDLMAIMRECLAVTAFPLRAKGRGCWCALCGRTDCTVLFGRRYRQASQRAVVANRDPCISVEFLMRRTPSDMAEDGFAPISAFRRGEMIADSAAEAALMKRDGPASRLFRVQGRFRPRPLLGCFGYVSRAPRKSSAPVQALFYAVFAMRVCLPPRLRRNRSGAGVGARRGASGRIVRGAS